MEKLNGVEGGKSEAESNKAAPGTVVNPTPETDMDALLLGRMGVSHLANQFSHFIESNYRFSYERPTTSRS